MTRAAKSFQSLRAEPHSFLCTLRLRKEREQYNLFPRESVRIAFGSAIALFFVAIRRLIFFRVAKITEDSHERAAESESDINSRAEGLCR